MKNRSLLCTATVIAGLWASGAAALTFNSTDIPKAIPDLATTNSVISIGDSFTITDLNVRIDLSHTHVNDLDILLIAPDGTKIELAENNGGDGDGYANTVFDDEAATEINDGSAPFIGSFRPQELLGALDGLDINGIWTLVIIDEGFLDIGTLHSWSIITPDQAIPEPAAALLFGAGLLGLRLIRRRSAT